MLDNQVDHVQPQHAIRQQWPTGKHVVEETCTALLWESNPTQQRHELQVHDVFMYADPPINCMFEGMQAS